MANMANAFRRKSLISCAVENDKEDSSFMHSRWLDLQTFHQHNYTQLLQPLNRRTCDQYHEPKRPVCLIDVLICLPNSDEDLGNGKDHGFGTRKPLPIGFINQHGVAKGTRNHRNLEIGILISAEHRRKGYETEAIQWVLDWSFEIAGLHRIGLQIASSNTGAMNFEECLGFQHDGNDREALCINGRLHDEVRFSILKSEWRVKIEDERTDRNG